jgi:hypothetical protein
MTDQDSIPRQTNKPERAPKLKGINRGMPRSLVDAINRNIEVTVGSEMSPLEFDEATRLKRSWTTSDGAYWAVGETCPTIPSNLYEPSFSDSIGHFLKAMVNNLDDIITLPDSESENLINEIKQFTTLKDKFHDHGFLYKRGILLWGPPGCLEENTLIHCETRSPEGVRHSHKYLTLERLYEKFHYIKGKGKGRYQLAPENSEFFTSSVDDEGRIFRNQILNVVKSGVKPCFKVTTAGGHSIEATAEHKFFNGTSYVKLEDMQVGDTVNLHLNYIPKRSGESPKRIDRNQLFVKHHPVAGTKIIGKYSYKRLAKARGVVEASRNGLTLNEYVDRLNSGKLEGLVFLSRKENVHHIDENVRNDVISNLLVVDQAEHAGIHATETMRLTYEVTEDVIVSIEPVGDKETYDLVMQGPYNNFIANKFTVHNSGKTVTIQQLISLFVKEQDGIAVMCKNPNLLMACLRDLRKVEPERQILVILEDIDALIDQEGETPFLNMLDGEAQLQNVVYVATTNYPERLDDRFKDRPSRFDTIRKIGMPTDLARKTYLKIKLPEVGDEVIEEYVQGSKGYSVAYLRELIVLTQCFLIPLEDALARLDKMRNASISSSDKEGKFGF